MVPMPDVSPQFAVMVIVFLVILMALDMAVER